MAPLEVRAFAPGRVNLIGEHTDYNNGLALAFAIAEGVRVRAQATDERRIRTSALDLDEHDELALHDLLRPATATSPDLPNPNLPPGDGWRAFVRGVAAELLRVGVEIPGTELEIHGNLPLGAGLSSSAALEVALCLALLGVAGAELDRRELARLCSRVENEWLGAHTGLLDQLASLYGAPDAALCIDFRTLHVEPVPLLLGDWSLVVLDSGEQHQLADSGYNQRRAECSQACQLLGVDSLRDADHAEVQALPEPLRRRALHVIDENDRVHQSVIALRDGDLHAMGLLLNASHRSLRDNYEVSTPAVEATAQRLRDAGASGARLVGGGFGGSVLGLFAPGSNPPADAHEVRPGPGAHLLDG